MLIGCCADIGQAELIKKSGFDYIEPALSAVCAMSEEEFKEKLAYVQKVGLPVLAVNCFLPGDWPLGHAPLDEKRNREYLEKAADRLSRLGVRTAVLGSGGARNLTEEYGWEKGKEQFKTFYCQAAAVLGEKGISVVIEPLNSQECTWLNTVGEALEFLETIPDEPKAVLCDFYHAGKEQEPLSVLKKAAPRLRHCHIAHPVTRKAPLPGDGMDYAPIFRALLECGYDRTMSFEGDSGNDPEILKSCAAYLKSFLAAK